MENPKYYVMECIHCGIVWSCDIVAAKDLRVCPVCANNSLVRSCEVAIRFADVLFELIGAESLLSYAVVKADEARGETETNKEN